jgi:hypothetical protein
LRVRPAPIVSFSKAISPHGLGAFLSIWNAPDRLIFTLALARGGEFSSTLKRRPLPSRLEYRISGCLIVGQTLLVWAGTKQTGETLCRHPLSRALSPSLLRSEPLPFWTISYRNPSRPRSPNPARESSGAGFGTWLDDKTLHAGEHVLSQDAGKCSCQ